MQFIVFFDIILSVHGEIGEVVNTPDCGSGMQGFDSLISPHIEKTSYHTIFIKNSVNRVFFDNELKSLVVQYDIKECKKFFFFMV